MKQKALPSDSNNVPLQLAYSKQNNLGVQIPKYTQLWTEPTTTAE